MQKKKRYSFKTIGCIFFYFKNPTLAFFALLYKFPFMGIYSLNIKLLSIFIFNMKELKLNDKMRKYKKCKLPPWFKLYF